MTTTPDDVRAAVIRFFGGPTGYRRDGFRVMPVHPDLMRDSELIARFADAVSNPPTSVRLAIHAKAHGPNRKLANEIIADWIVSLIDPNAKETA